MTQPITFQLPFRTTPRFDRATQFSEEDAELLSSLVTYELASHGVETYVEEVGPRSDRFVVVIEMRDSDFPPESRTYLQIDREGTCR